jgi:anti-sigma B factor antagonist
MRAAMDELAVTHGDDGTVVQMSRRLANAAGERGRRPVRAAPAPSTPRPSSDASGTSVVGAAELRLMRDDGVLIAALDGEIDMANARDVFGRITAALDNRARGLILDLSTTRYLDSSGLQALLELGRRTRFRGQELRVVAPLDSAPRAVLEMVGVQDSIALHATVPEALSGSSEPKT